MNINIDYFNSKYNVFFDCQYFLEISKYISENDKYEKVILITDENVDKIFKKNFDFKNTESYKYVIKAGEKSKNIAQYYKLIRFLTSINVDRNDLIIALGGGVVGDLAGFIASTYMRGIDYIQVPTSLLAMVDSSIGSKTAINTEDGKNLIGSFYAPKAVFIDLDFLKTLPQEEFTNGLAEIIKCSIIKDKNLFDLINEEEIYDRNTMSNIIKRSIEIKKEIVEKDPKEINERQLLNFGHTIGHAIEKVSNYSIAHGYAVATGMAMITRSYYKQGLTDTTSYNSINEILLKYKLPICCDYSLENLYKEILRDKKSRGDTLNVIYPKKIGDGRISSVEKNDLRKILKYCFER